MAPSRPWKQWDCRFLKRMHRHVQKKTPGKRKGLAECRDRLIAVAVGNLECRLLHVGQCCMKG